MKIGRLGIIGDVHAADKHLDIALRFLHNLELDEIVCVGDIADGRGSLERCCQLFQSTPVITVRGNHDFWFLNNQMRDLPVISPRAGVSAGSRAFLESLPPTTALDTLGGGLLLCHGTGSNDMLAVLPEDEGIALELNGELQRVLAGRQFRFMVCGHTHRPMVKNIGHLTIINPGLLADGDESGVSVVDFAAGSIQFYDFVAGGLVATSEPVPLTQP